MTDVGFVRMRVSKVVGLRDGDRAGEFVVLEEPGGDRRLLIQIGQVEAFALAANLGEMEWGRPATSRIPAKEFGNPAARLPHGTGKAGPS